MTITFRKDKKYPLTYPEMDENFRDLLEDTDLQRVTENGNTANLGLSVNTLQIDTLVRKKAPWYTEEWSTGLITSSNNNVITIPHNHTIYGNTNTVGQIRANGTVIQSNSSVMSYVYTTTASNNVPALIEPLTLTITPKNKNNKILCELDLSYSTRFDNYIDSDETEILIERDGLFIANSTVEASSHYYYTGAPYQNYKMRKFRLNFMDDAKDTQTITYKIFLKVKRAVITLGSKYGNHGGIKEISGTVNCVAIIRESGVLQTWGDNSSGNLGLGDKDYRSVPVTVQSGGTNLLCKKVSVARKSMIAIDINDNLWQWGLVGNATSYSAHTSTPVLISSSGDWDKIFNIKDEGLTLFAQTKFAIKKNGTLWTWGYNYFGKSGLNIPSTSTAVYPSGGYVPSPVQVGSLTNWKKVVSNLYTAVGIAGTNLYGWGENAYGQLGTAFPVATRRSSPVLVTTNVLDVDLNYNITTMIRQSTRTDDWGTSTPARDAFFMGNNTQYNVIGITPQFTVTQQINYSSPVNVGLWWWNVDAYVRGDEERKFYEDFETCHAGLYNAFWISQSNTTTGNVYNTVYPTGSNIFGWSGMENGSIDILFYSNNILYPNKTNLSGTVPDNTSANQKFHCAIGGSGESYYLKNNDVFSWGIIPIHIWGSTWKNVDPEIESEFPVNPAEATDNVLYRSRPTLVMSVNPTSNFDLPDGLEYPRLIRINGNLNPSNIPNFQNVTSSFILTEISS